MQKEDVCGVGFTLICDVGHRLSPTVLRTSRVPTMKSRSAAYRYDPPRNVERTSRFRSSPNFLTTLFLQTLRS